MAEWVTAVTAIALVVLTAAYAWQTRQLVVEMRATREETVRPALRVTPEVLGVNFPVARITNVGPGHAVNVNGRLTIHVAETERWSYDLQLPIVVPGGFRDFVPRLGESEQPTVQALAEEQRVFRMNVDYEDPVGRRHHAEGEADWSVITEHMWGAGMLRPEDQLRKIEKHAERIAKSLSDVTSSSDGVRVTTYRERKLQAQEWEREWAERQGEEKSSSPE